MFVLAEMQIIRTAGSLAVVSGGRAGRQCRVQGQMKEKVDPSSREDVFSLTPNLDTKEERFHTPRSVLLCFLWFQTQVAYLHI